MKNKKTYLMELCKGDILNAANQTLNKKHFEPKNPWITQKNIASDTEINKHL